jgi:hypothetical protein
MKKVPYSGPKITGRLRKKFSRQYILAREICAPLLYLLLFVSKYLKNFLTVRLKLKMSWSANLFSVRQIKHA